MTVLMHYAKRLAKGVLVLVVFYYALCMWARL